jgi:RHS repeat-associated protein
MSTQEIADRAPFREMLMPRHAARIVASFLTLTAALAAAPALASSDGTVGMLQAPMNTTALTGRVLTVDGKPLPNILLTDGRVAATRTDAEGRFLLEFVPPGKSVMRIDGRHGGIDKSTDYGTYEVQVTAVGHRTTPLPFTSWLTPIDHANDIVVPSPTTGEVVVSTPRIPGLELHIPAGTVLTDWDGKRINRISLTPVRADRPPFPLPRDVMFADYFTAQPGGTRLWTMTGAHAAATVIYPNHGAGIPGSRASFWHYHPETVGWLPYGGATVSADGKSIIPDEGSTVWDFMGGGNPGDDGGDKANSNPANTDMGSTATASGGDPVDLGSGFFTKSMTDMTISDIMPISLTRSYISSDTNYRDFGLAMSLSYEMFLTFKGNNTGGEPSEEFSELNLNTAKSSIPFLNTTPAYGDYSNALFLESSAPGPFLQAQASWTGNGFQIRQRNGMTYGFGYHSPVSYIQDRFNNKITFSYEQVIPAPANTKPGQQYNRLAKISSPNGRFIEFTWTDLYPGGSYGGYSSPTGSDIYVISEATDNLGRITNYTYDACGRLMTVQDAHAVAQGLSNTTNITWSTSAPAYGSGACPTPTGAQAPLNLLYNISDQSGNLIVQNDQYEYSGGSNNCESAGTPSVNGRVCKQELGAPGTSSNPVWSYSYTVDANNNITMAQATDPREHIHQVNFTLPSQQGSLAAPANTAGFPSSEIYAEDDSTNSQTWTYQRDPNNFTLTQITAPPLVEEHENTGRVTALCYDGQGAGTAGAAPAIYRPWNLTSVVRNLTSSGTACPTAVQTGSMTQNATTLFTYSPTYNQVATITDPNGNTTTFCRSGSQTGCSSQTYPYEEALSIIDANSNVTNLAYYANGQIESTSRAATSSQTLETSYTYDHNDLATLTVVGGTDVASRTWVSFTDGVGRSIRGTDPLGDISTTNFDPIFGPSAVYDPNNEYLSFNYHPNGTLYREAQPNGTSQYGYNAADLLLYYTDPLNYGLSNPVQARYGYDLSSNHNCTVDRRGSQANFVYDSLNRLYTATYYLPPTTGTASCTGTPVGTLESMVTYGYDHGNRLLTVTDTIGGTTTRTFDDLDRLTSDVQTAPGSGASIGTVSYGYDLGGRLTTKTPTNVQTSTYVYDPGNRLTAITTASSTVCINYDGADRRTALVLPNGLTANYSFDTESDLTELNYLSGGSYSGSTCTPGQGNRSGTGTLTYSFDGNGRQIARAGTLYTAVYPSPVAASSVAFNADNQLTMWNSQANFYDGNGNITCSGSSSSSTCTGSTQTFTWDARNRMSSATAAPGSGGYAETYVYDGLSRRQSVGIPSAIPPSAATSLYDGLNAITITTSNTSTGGQIDFQKFLLGLGLDERFSAYDANNGNSTFVADSQGSTVKLVPDGLNPANVAYMYPPFGSTGAPSTTFPNTFRYTGREASDNTGLYYYRGRYYNPAWSRFVSEDPILYAAGPNVYAYANNDPLNLIDALGLDSYSFYAATKSVFLGPVNSGFSHTSVIIVDVGDMGTTYTDLAAGPSNSFGKVGTLFGLSTLTPAYTGDRLADDLSGQLSSNQLTPIQVPPGQTPEDFAANLTAAADTYQGGDEYDAMGGGGFLGYNSNSFAAGVIGAAGGIPPSLSATLPGYFTPLPMAKQNCQ